MITGLCCVLASSSLAFMSGSSWAVLRPPLACCDGNSLLPVHSFFPHCVLSPGLPFGPLSCFSIFFLSFSCPHYLLNSKAGLQWLLWYLPCSAPSLLLPSLFLSLGYLLVPFCACLGTLAPMPGIWGFMVLELDFVTRHSFKEF